MYNIDDQKTNKQKTERYLKKKKKKKLIKSFLGVWLGQVTQADFKSFINMLRSDYEEK